MQKTQVLNLNKRSIAALTIAISEEFFQDNDSSHTKDTTDSEEPPMPKKKTTFAENLTKMALKRQNT